MTRGTAYAALEIILWLLAAAVVGFAIGWLLSKWRTDNRVEQQIQTVRAEEERNRHKLQLELADCETRTAAATADLEHRTADLDRVNIRLAEKDKVIAGLRDDRSAARSTEMKLEAKVEDRESTIATLRASIGKEDKQFAALKRDLDAASGTVGALRKDAEGYRTTIEALRADLDVERRKQNDRSANLEAALAAAQRERDKIADRFRSLQAEHAGCVEAAARDEVPAGDKLPAHDEVPAADTAIDTPLPDKDVAMARVLEIATRTRGEGPVVDDDLKKIHGVGPKLEKLLKSMHITSFSQVANFTPDDIQYVTAALEAFPGRIERDDWMSSAAKEHAAKYDEPAS